MASTRTELNRDFEPVQAANAAPSGFDPARDLPAGFIEFLLPLHRAFTPRQRDLIGRRVAALEASHDGHLPNYLPPSRATHESWRIELARMVPGPAQSNDRPRRRRRTRRENAELRRSRRDARPGRFHGQHLAAPDARNHKHPFRSPRRTQLFRPQAQLAPSQLKPSNTVISLRPRGLHLRQTRVLNGERLPASLFDVALIAFQVNSRRAEAPAHLLHSEIRICR